MKRVARKVSNLFLTLVILLGCLVGNLVPATTVMAQGYDISDKVVTNLSVSSNEIQDGGRVSVTVNFAENSSHNIQGGDTINVTWPKTGQPTFNGYVKTLPLMVKGVTVGEAAVRQDGATLTFNDSVNNLDEVAGYVTFEIEGRNTTDTTQEDRKSGTITSGGRSATVTVVKPEAGTSSAFYYKTGNMDSSDTDHVNWWLNANLEKAYVDSDIRIEDYIQGGQELVTDSFNIDVEGIHPNSLYGAGALVEFANKYPGSSISVDGNHISVVIARGYASNNHFTINYKTKITNPNQKQFVNNSKAWYKENGKDAVDGEDFNHVVDNVNASSGITGTLKGELKIVKKIEGTEIPIPDVIFELKNTEGTEIKDGQTVLQLKTNSEGIANVKGLPVGNYTVKEISAPDWIDFDLLNSPEKQFSVSASDTEGTLLSVENKAKNIEVTGKKTWNDGDNQDGLRPTSIKVNLLANGTVINSQTVTADDDWSYSFTDLPKYANGSEIAYTVEEANTPDGYTSVVDGTTITNTHIPETTEVSGTKTWNDSDDQDGKRPETIKVHLLANGTEVASQEVTADSNWSYSFTELPKYAKGSEIVYTVTEDAVADYTTTYDGYNITNSYTPGKTSITVTKVWDDNNDQDGIRPNAIQVQLYANGKVSGDVITLSAANNWIYTWTGLAEKANKKAITYTVEEVTAIDGYTSETTQTSANNFTITNTHTPETTELSGTKVWDDNDDQDGLRPTSIKVNLLANGTVINSQTVTADDDWSYSFTDLPKYANGSEIAYTVEEANTPDGYTSVVDGTTITNTHIPETTEVSGTKTWNDSDDQDGKRPETIKVHLLANGTEVASQEVTADSNWSYSFTELPKYAKGSEIVYTVTEDAVADYTTTYDGYNITNSYTPGKTSITVTKVWDDNNDQDGIRPNAIQVQLYANGKVSGDVITLSAANNWIYTWTGLAEKANKKAITYTVEEVTAIDGYTSETTQTSANNFTITNTHTPETTELSGTKVWDDNDDQDGLRPTSIKVNLLANGTVINSQTVTADDDWSYSFTDLPKYANGSEIAYTVEEANTPDGYTSVVDGTTITNTHIPETTEVSGTKTWNDSDDQDGKRPETIKVHLLANGTEVASQEVTADSNWSYSFTELPKYAKGSEIVYTVTEDAVADYTTTYDGYNITNSYTPGKTSITVTKVWDDNNDQDGIRPNAIQVQLYANGKVSGDVITLSAANNWIYTWTGLAEKANKKAITYTVEEVTAIDGYTSETTQTSANNFTITNTHTPETTELSGTKVWDDNDDQDGLRPTSIKVNLLANGTVINSQTVTADDDWSYSFTDLPKYANGSEIAYTVEEANTPDGYTSVVDGTTITNTHIPETTEVSGTKTWNDSDDQDGKRPETIKVHLLANGTEVASQEVTADSNWSYSFTELPKYAKGSEIVYTVTEDAVADYTTTYDGYNITNSYTPGKTSITVTKVWDDNNDQDGIRPNAIQVQLYANGKVSGDVITLSAANNWIYTWTGLAEKANKKDIAYTVKELSDVEGYTATVGDIDNGNVTITNSHTPTTPEEPTTPSKPNKKSDKQSKDKKSGLLPSTGDSDGFGLSILGVTIIVTLIAGFVYYRKHN